MAITPISAQVTRSSCYSQFPPLSPTVKSCLEKKSLTHPETESKENFIQTESILSKETRDKSSGAITVIDDCYKENLKNRDLSARFSAYFTCAESARKFFKEASPSYGYSTEFDPLQFFYAYQFYHLYDCSISKLVEIVKKTMRNSSPDGLYFSSKMAPESKNLNSIQFHYNNNHSQLTHETTTKARLHFANMSHFLAFSDTNTGKMWMKTFLSKMKKVESNPQTDLEIPEILDDDSWLNS